MIRVAMAKKIEDTLGMSELDGVRHTDRPTWWLRQMIAEIERHESEVEKVGCLKCELIRAAHSL
jgi:hypothetical protein